MKQQVAKGCFIREVVCTEEYSTSPLFGYN